MKVPRSLLIEYSQIKVNNFGRLSCPELFECLQVVDNIISKQRQLFEFSLATMLKKVSHLGLVVKTKATLFSKNHLKGFTSSHQVAQCSQVDNAAAINVQLSYYDTFLCTIISNSSEPRQCKVIERNIEFINFFATQESYSSFFQNSVINHAIREI